MDFLASVAQQLVIGVLSCGVWDYLAPTSTIVTYRLKPAIARMRKQIELKITIDKTSIHFTLRIKEPRRLR